MACVVGPSDQYDNLTRPAITWLHDFEGESRPTPMHASHFVKSYMDAWNQHDPVGVADHLTEDGIYRDIPAQLQQSHDELVATLYEFFSRFHHRYELIGDVLSSENTVAFQYRMVPVDDDLGAVYQGAEFITLRDDSAQLITDYYDAPDLLAPSVASKANRRVTHRKYAKSGLADDKLRSYKCELDRIMQDQQLFLHPELTLPAVADIVKCSVNHLSQVINAGFGVSFFDYINRYRIEHAKELLNNLDADDPVLTIAFAVGFNSNSAFYAAFKKHVGMTPAQYRRITA